MLSLDHAVSTVARDLAAPAPAPDPDGSFVFELDDGLRLGVTPLADGSALIAWSIVSEPRPGESLQEAGDRAAGFLRVHLGRLRHCGRVTACRGRRGEGLLFIRSVPSGEEEWLEDVGALLNEAETVRNILSGSGKTMFGGAGGASLFSGMSGLLG